MHACMGTRGRIQKDMCMNMQKDMYVQHIPTNTCTNTNCCACMHVWEAYAHICMHAWVYARACVPSCTWLVQPRFLPLHLACCEPLPSRSPQRSSSGRGAYTVIDDPQSQHVAPPGDRRVMKRGVRSACPLGLGLGRTQGRVMMGCCFLMSCACASLLPLRR